MSVIAAGRYSSRWARLIPIAFITCSLAYVVASSQERRRSASKGWGVVESLTAVRPKTGPQTFGRVRSDDRCDSLLLRRVALEGRLRVMRVGLVSCQPFPVPP
jgi:hypothetical protein